MQSVLVRLTEEGIEIPREYLADADSYELLILDDRVVVRPMEATGQNGHSSVAKDEAGIDPNPETDLEMSGKTGWPYDWIGIAETKDPTASSRVEEILAEEWHPHH